MRPEDRSNRYLIYVIAILWLGTAVPAKDYKKVGGGLNFFSAEQEAAMGKQYADELNQKLELVADPFVTQYINQIGQKLVANSFNPGQPYQFFVVNTREVNAFALPGGFIYVNRGLIEQAGSESELAGVIGHEIGHVAARHSTKQLSKKLLLAGAVMGTGAAVGTKSEKWSQLIMAAGGIGTFFATMKFSRDDERQADWLGLTNLGKAGYDPAGMITFFQKLDTLSKKSGGGPGLAFMSTHPLPAERVRNMQNEIKMLEARPEQPVVNTRSFDRCRSRLDSIPLPPPKEEKTLSNALLSLNHQSGGNQSTGTSSPAVSSPAAPVRPVTRSFQVPGDTVWLDTGLTVTAGDRIEIQAGGQIVYRKDGSTCGPAGAPGTGKGFWKPLPSANTGALIGRLGSSAYQYIVIGTGGAWIAGRDGQLFLGINDDNSFDNKGVFQVTITIGRTTGSIP